MTIKEILAQAYRQLESAPQGAIPSTTKLDAQVLLCHVLNCNTARLMAWPEQTLNSNQQKTFLNLIKQRQQAYPVAYLTGHKEFWSLDLKVSPATLIPRPETELLVETILKKFAHHDTLKLADLGTGSGAIAIALASEQAGWKITATDISAASLNIARHNARQYQLNNIRFLSGHWFNPLEGECYDIIASNPPYIADQDPHLKQGDIQFEPDNALRSGAEGMDDISYLCQHASRYLKPGGLLIIEHGYNQQQAVLNCLIKNNYRDISQLKDLSGHSRVSTGYTNTPSAMS